LTTVASLGSTIVLLGSSVGLLRSISLLTVGVLTVGVLTVGVLTVGVLTVGVLTVGFLTVGFLTVLILTVRILTVGILTVGFLTVGILTIGILTVGFLTVGFLTVGILTVGFLTSVASLLTVGFLSRVLGLKAVSLRSGDFHALLSAVGVVPNDAEPFLFKGGNELGEIAFLLVLGNDGLDNRDSLVIEGGEVSGMSLLSGREFSLNEVVGSLKGGVTLSAQLLKLNFEISLDYVECFSKSGLNSVDVIGMSTLSGMDALFVGT